MKPPCHLSHIRYAISLAFIFILMPNSSVVAQQNIRTCGVYSNRNRIIGAEKLLGLLKLAQAETNKNFRVQTLKRGGELKVYFHVISDGATGDIPDAMIKNQINVLNSTFKETGWSFNLARENITRTSNAEWFYGCYDRDPDTFAPGPVETAMKTALRRGKANDLNIYTCKPKGQLGYAQYPFDYAKYPVQDGVVLLYKTLPGGGRERFDLGHTGTHEVGHWMGLYHPSDGGCSGDGDDLVDDTPAEETPASGCPIDRDTCPAPGLDPITNFMDYSDDSCMTEFTPGQSVRMTDSFNYYRLGN